MSEIVVKSLSPVTVEREKEVIRLGELKADYAVDEAPFSLTEQNDTFRIGIWGRTYTIGKTPFFSSMVSQGTELLSGPVRVVIADAREELSWSNAVNMRMAKYDDTFVDIHQALQNDLFILNTAMHTEYDGCVKCDMSIMPVGLRVGQCWGLGGAVNNRPRIISKLWLEIPVKKNIAKFYQYYPVTNKGVVDGKCQDIPPVLYLDDKLYEKDLFLGMSGDMPEKSLQLPFKQNLYVGNDHCGLSVFFDSDENWQPADIERAIECEVREDEVIIRVHLLDSDPVQWQHKGADFGRSLLPVHFSFGLQATPVKPLTRKLYEEKNIHIDCYKKIPVAYDDFLLNPYPGSETGELVLDRLARLGVNTVYLHEKWNDFQNCFDLTEDCALRLREIVRACHARGMKVLTYFGFEISTQCPIGGKDFGKHIAKRNELGHQNSWYRYPWQRAVQVCYGSNYAEYFLQGVETIMDEYGIDGIYLDGTYSPPICCNEKHGCGYRDHNGNLHGTFPVWQVRDMVKRLYKIVDSRGGIINIHTNHSFLPYLCAFAHSIWDGEVPQGAFLRGEVNTAMESYFRPLYTGRTLGLPVNMLCYTNEPKWTFSQALSNTLPLGIIPKPVDVGAPLEEMSKIWAAFDSFPVAEASWHPYFENNLAISNDVVKASYYKAGSRLLVLVANFVNWESGDAVIRFPKKVLSCRNAMTGEMLDVNGDAITVSFEKFDYRILDVELD